jgi:Flp pilus assembly protein TadD
MAEAAAAYRRVLALRPDIAEVHNNLGVILKNQGRLDQAAAEYQQAIALKPDFVEACNNLGNVLRQQGQLDQAAARYQQAIALKPDYAEAHNNLGIILWQQDKLDQAVARYQQALALKPNFAEAHNNLGNALKRQGKFDQALARFEQAIALRPDYAEAHSNLGSVLLSLGNVLKEQGKFDQALARFEQALVLRPDYAEAHNNLGNLLLGQDKLDEAAAHYEQALALKPDFAEAHNNLGTVLSEQGKLDEAAARYEQALALRPDFADAQMGLATCFLVRGDYERGWPGYETRLRVSGFVPPHGLPRWRGEPLAGRSLLLWAEQGLGDTLQFVRYGRLLKKRGARVVLACPAALGRLLASQADSREFDRQGPDRQGPDWDELFILGSTAELPRTDFYLPLLSAPGALGTTAATIPREVPYLWADPELSADWRRELAGMDGFKIGIAWQGSRDPALDRGRSIPLAHFAPLARLPGVRLISLQKGFGSEQVATVDFPILDLSGRLDEVAGPFMDTTAVIGNVDLVVTSDTSIAHLAGALGAPVWVALQFAAEWRWLLERDDSPWYPTMRLFRQTTFGGWPDVFDRIAEAVQARRLETT